MARGELLRKLFLSHQRGGDDEFRAAALEIIAEEQNKNNRQLARDLLRILDNSISTRFVGSYTSPDLNALPKDRERDALLVDVQHPTATSGDIILRPANRAAVDRIIAEFKYADVLRTHGLTPKRKILFVGPPGCGKTLCAHVMAGELGLPVLYTRFDAIVSSYLGETAANLRKVFTYASSGHWLVLFDEFDAIGKRRDDENEHGELKRVVNSFLQLLDGFAAPSLMVAATNHEQLLDPALWRRFDEIVEFPRPTLQEIIQLVHMKLKNFRTSDLDIKTVAAKLRGMSHSDIERICIDAIKGCVIDGKEQLDTAAFQVAWRQQKERLHIYRNAFRNTGDGA